VVLARMEWFRRGQARRCGSVALPERRTTATLRSGQSYRRASALLLINPLRIRNDRLPTYASPSLS
jgi:hypothetical protein